MKFESGDLVSLQFRNLGKAHLGSSSQPAMFTDYAVLATGPKSGSIIFVNLAGASLVEDKKFVITEDFLFSTEPCILLEKHGTNRDGVNVWSVLFSGIKYFVLEIYLIAVEDMSVVDVNDDEYSVIYYTHPSINGTMVS